MAKPGALANLNVEAAIAEIASGALMHQIAARYGVGKSALRRKINYHPNYHEAIQSQAECLVDQTTSELMDVAADAVLIARARARVDGAHRWAQARDPARWAPRQSIAVIPAVQTLGDREELIIEAARRIAYLVDAASRLPHRSTEIIDADIVSNGGNSDDNQ